MAGIVGCVFGAVFFFVGIAQCLGVLDTRALIRALVPETDESAQAFMGRSLQTRMGAVVAAAGVLLFAAGLFEPFRTTLFRPAMLVWFVITGVVAYRLERDSRVRG